MNFVTQRAVQLAEKRILHGSGCRLRLRQLRLRRRTSTVTLTLLLLLLLKQASTCLGLRGLDLLGGAMKLLAHNALNRTLQTITESLIDARRVQVVEELLTTL